MRNPRLIVYRAETKAFIKGRLRRGMGIKEIEPCAGMRDDRDQQLLANSPAAMAIANIEMANAPGPRLLAEGVDVQTADPN